MRSTVITLIAAGLLLGSCGGEVPLEDRVAALRDAHEITPLGYTTVKSPGEEPVLVVDLRVVNQAREPLPHLTVLVRVIGPDGSIKVERRHPLDLRDVRPGYSVQVAARIPGIEAEETDQVQLELETGLSDHELSTLQEYRDLAGE